MLAILHFAVFILLVVLWVQWIRSICNGEDVNRHIIRVILLPALVILTTLSMHHNPWGYTLGGWAHLMFNAGAPFLVNLITGQPKNSST